MKTGTTGLLKFRLLKRKLSRPEFQVIGILQGIWNLATDNADDGAIGRFTDDEIAAYLEWDGIPGELIDALVDTRWLDRCDTNRLIVHDWSDHAPNFIKKRQHKRSERRRGDTNSQNGDTNSRRVIVGDTNSRIGDMVAPTQHNPTQPNNTKPNQNGNSREFHSELIPTDPPEFATPPEFDDGLAAIWDRIASTHRSAHPHGPALKLTVSRRYALHEALREETADDVVDAFHCLSTSPNPRAVAIRSKWRGIDTLLQPDKLRSYVEFARSADAWDSTPTEAQANERAIEESLARITRGTA